MTKPLKLMGKTLHLNAKSDYGEILVTIMGEDGTQLAESKPVKCDSLDVAVEWETFDPAALNGPVTLGIDVRNALLFALWCTP